MDYISNLKSDCLNNQLVNSTRNKTEIDKLNPSNNLSNIIELNQFNGQIPRFNNGKIYSKVLFKIF